MNNVTAILSMLHEPPAMHPDSPVGDGPMRFNSATRFFRGEPVLSWAMRRLTRSRHLGNIAVLCWEDQLPPVEEIAEEHHAYVLAKGPRQNISSIESLAAARKWSDGWRGGLLSTCDFDLGFHADWIKELSDRLESDAIVLVDPSAGLVDPSLIDQVIEHAREKSQAELCFTQAAPGLGGVLLRPVLLDRLCSSRAHPGRFVHYMPEAPMRDPIGTDACVPVATPVARSTRSFKLDSQRQLVRISEAAESLNGSLASSDAEQIVNRLQWSQHVDELPREIVIELNTDRRTSPIYWPGRHARIERSQSLSIEDWSRLLTEAAAADDLRLTIAGVGDPVESELLLPLIDVAHAAGVNSVHVQTDLLCEDASRVADLASGAVDIVSVNLPAMRVETYLEIMGVDGLKRAMENVATLVRTRNARGSGVPVIVPVFTKCADNLAEMEAWYDQWLGALGCAVIDGPSDYAGLIPDVSLADMSPQKRSACARLSSRLTIHCDGTVVACEQDVAARSPFGNVRSDSLRDVWNRRLAPLRADHACGQWGKHATCGACRQWHRP